MKTATAGPWGYKVFLKYMAAVQRAFREGTGYTEQQCEVCPYEHKCCTLAVSVTPFEAMGIAWFLNRATFFSAGAIKQKIKERALLYREATAGKSEVDAAEKWYTKGLHCVFYDLKRRRCSIYEARPMACRGVYSVWDCSKLRWQIPRAFPGVLERLIGMCVLWVGSTYEQNVGEMCNMLERFFEQPKTVTYSAGSPDSFIGMAQRVRRGEEIGDKELIFGAPSQPVVPSPDNGPQPPAA